MILLVLLDVSVAFNTINHSSLLDCLIDLGTGGIALQQFYSYFSDGFQAMLLRDSLLLEMKIIFLWALVCLPMLFNIFIKPLGDLDWGLPVG